MLLLGRRRAGRRRAGAKGLFVGSMGPRPVGGVIFSSCVSGYAFHLGRGSARQGFEVGLKVMEGWDDRKVSVRARASEFLCITLCKAEV